MVSVTALIVPAATTVNWRGRRVGSVVVLTVSVFGPAGAVFVTPPSTIRTRVPAASWAGFEEAFDLQPDRAEATADVSAVPTNTSLVTPPLNAVPPGNASVMRPVLAMPLVGVNSTDVDGPRAGRRGGVALSTLWTVT